MTQHSGLDTLKENHLYRRLDEKEDVYSLIIIALNEAQLTKYKEAEEYLKRALKLVQKKYYSLSDRLSIWSALALCYEGMSDHQSACKAYEHIFELSIGVDDIENELIFSQFSNYLLNAGKYFLKLKKYKESINFLERSLKLLYSSECLLYIVEAYVHHSDFYKAGEILIKSLELYPQDFHVYISLSLFIERVGNLFFKDKVDESLKKLFFSSYYFKNILNKNSTNDSTNTSSVYLIENGLKFIGYAEVINAHNAHIKYVFANLLSLAGRTSFAIKKYQEVICLEPTHFKALNNLSVLYGRLLDKNSAMMYLRRSLQALNESQLSNYELTLLYFNAGTLALTVFDYAYSKQCFEKALVIDPFYPQLLGAYLHLRMRLCDWHSIVEIKINNSIVSVGFESMKMILINQLDQGNIVINPFVLLSITSDANVHLKCTQNWVNSMFSGIGQSAVFTKNAQKINSNGVSISKGTKKIRVGYFSSDFKEHATSYLIARLFEIHDKERFELFAYCWSADDQSQIRSRIKASFSYWFDVKELEDQQIVQLANSHHLDFAIDLKGYTEGSRPQLFIERLAKYHVSYLGYPGTLAAPWIDFCVVDKFLIPKEFEIYMSEKLIYLDCCYQVNDDSQSIYPLKTSRPAHKLPSNAVVIAALHSSYKITPEIFKCWMEILIDCPATVLWLLEENSFIKKNLSVHLKAYGLSKERVIFAKKLPHDEHLERIKHADLFLDTFPCNAHTSASDFIWAGVPIVTLCGQSFASRVASSLLTFCGLSELITYDLDRYKRKILEMVFDRNKLNKCKNHLISMRNEKSNSLFNTSLFLKQWEKWLISVAKN